MDLLSRSVSASALLRSRCQSQLLPIVKHPKRRNFGDFTNTQMNALKQGWKVVHSHGFTYVNKRILNRLEQSCPPVKQIFYKSAFLKCVQQNTKQASTINDHALLLRKMLEDLFLNLTNYDKCEENMQLIGRHHATLKECGFTADIWERFGEIAVEVVTGLDGMQSNKDACRAWRVLLASATDNLRYGYEQGCRNRPVEK